jgi:hypothetical protein
VRKVGTKLKNLVAETQRREATAAERVDKVSKMRGGAMNTSSSLKAKIDELEKTVLSSRALFSFTASLLHSFTPSLFLVSSLFRLHSFSRFITVHSSVFTPSLFTLCSVSLSFLSSLLRSAPRRSGLEAAEPAQGDADGGEAGREVIQTRAVLSYFIVMCCPYIVIRRINESWIR